jgi:hypothetical protein
MTLPEMHWLQDKPGQDQNGPATYPRSSALPEAFRLHLAHTVSFSEIEKPDDVSMRHLARLALPRFVKDFD